jgi:hypothetical protein
VCCVLPPNGVKLFSSPPCPDLFWGNPSLLSRGYRRYSGRGAKLTGHLHLMPMLRMCGAIPPVTHTDSWHGAYLSRGYVFMVWHLVFCSMYLVKHRDSSLPCAHNKMKVCACVQTSRTQFLCRRHDTQFLLACPWDRTKVCKNKLTATITVTIGNISFYLFIDS